MNVRILPVVIYTIAFLLALFSVAAIPKNVLNIMPNWYLLALIINLSVSLSGVLVAFWVYEDGKIIDDMYSFYLRETGGLEDETKKKEKSPVTGEELL